MKKVRFRAFSLPATLSLALIFAGCGLFYQAGTRIKATRMSDTLQVGQTSPQIHHSWGEPDIRTYLPGDTEVWSYAKRSNTNDIAATLLYTNTKEGDQGQFLDLTFVDGKLASWKQTTHTMPPKKGGPGLSFGLSGPGSTTGNQRHY